MDKRFKIKFISCNEQELQKIGFDSSYIKKAVNKHKFFTIKISNLNCAQANILKQTALSCGTDCAVHREVITGKIYKSDCILSGTISEIEKIAQKLKKQPFSLKNLSEEILSLINNSSKTILINNKEINLYEKTYIMGILNITPDSFSDGGKYNNKNNAIKHFKEMAKDGADIIDIGGESTRPYSQTLPQEEEIKRVIPIIKSIREFDKNTIISIDTRNASTAQKAIEAGANIINDVSALEWDKEMINVLKTSQVPIILNHSKGTPDIMQNNTDYNDVVDTIYDYFEKKIKYLTNQGIHQEKIIIDPGIGFGKSIQQNFVIIKRIKELKSLGCPILVGHSRKNFIKQTLNTQKNEELDTGTLILSQILQKEGVNILRVHNTKIHSYLNKLNESLI